MPPEDQALYFIQAGKYLETDPEEILPQKEDDGFLRAGYSTRITPTMGGNIGFSTNSDSTMLEAGIFKQGESYELQSGFSYDEYNIAGSDIRFRYRYSLGEINTSTRKIWGSDVPEDEDSQIGNEKTQTNISALFRTDYGSASVFYNFNEDSDSNSNKSYGLRWNFGSLFRSPRLSGNLELSENEGNALFLLSLSYRLQSGSWTNTATTEYRNEEQDDEPREEDVSGSVSSSWRSSQENPNRYQVNLRSDHQDTDSLQSKFDAQTDLGSANLSVRHTLDDDRTEYNGSVRTSFAATSESIGFGGKSRSTAGFLVKVEGEKDDETTIDVMVNSSKRATLKLNQERFVPVSEYDTYEIDFKARGGKLQNIEYSSRPYTIYPGNVISIKASVDQVFVAVGKIVDTDGVPLSNALLRGVNGLATTDQSGFFQAELKQGTTQISAIKSQQECQIDLPEYTINNQIAFLKTVTCH
jgi:outer membrane usher protein FimD/PapC